MRFTSALVVLSAFAGQLVVASPTNGGGSGSGGGLNVVGCALSTLGCIGPAAGDLTPVTKCIAVLPVSLPIDPVGTVQCVVDGFSEILASGVKIPNTCNAGRKCLCDVLELPLGLCSTSSK